MKITIEMPDSTRCVNISLVYQADAWSMAMAASMFGSEELKDGAAFKVPKNKQAGWDKRLRRDESEEELI